MHSACPQSAVFSKGESAMAPTKILKQKDANRKILAGKTVAVIGYGSQGHAFALNLKDEGVSVLVGLYSGSVSAEVARKHGFEVLPTAKAVARADIVVVAVPDMKQAEIYARDIEPNLAKGKTLVFLHGLSVSAGLVQPRADVNVAMVAPKAPGHTVRSLYVDGMGVPALIAVYQGGKAAKEIALALADGIGATRAGVIETTFKDETDTDLFGEQAVICGGVVALVKAGFETLVEAGYKPEMAYFECCHELKMIVDLINQSGISGMRFSVSETAKYGDVTRGERIVGSKTKSEMKRVLKEIQSGKFVREWQREYDGGLKKYKKLLAAGETHLIEKIGQRLRSLMPWVAKQNIKGARAAFSAVLKK